MLQHSSDCAVHNEPAYPNGLCDCGALPTVEKNVDLKQLSKTLADRFLGWHLPLSVCSDLCVTTREGQHQHLRTGTNLLDANEAQQMIEYLFEDATLATILQPPPPPTIPRTETAAPDSGEGE